MAGHHFYFLSVVVMVTLVFFLKQKDEKAKKDVKQIKKECVLKALLCILQTLLKLEQEANVTVVPSLAYTALAKLEMLSVLLPFNFTVCLQKRKYIVHVEKVKDKKIQNSNGAVFFIKLATLTVLKWNQKIAQKIIKPKLRVSFVSSISSQLKS